ncbi:MAG: UDP-N-acetylmuramoyl-tripeptide--D-alanyl-D-alanine ligase [Actinobacteria bacterium]|nr:UDP-N-acetylmuramoyl-tripeptide--D-alanyl-D-alanine ligase [Actinomycetota bacterium]
MIELSRSQGAVAIGVPTLSAPVVGVSTDTRTLRPGDLFVAIKGESYDGHQFVPAALARDASCVVVQLGIAIAGDMDYESPRGHVPIYRVPDTRAALAGLAREVRRASEAKVIAITGSVGKTSTKDLIRCMAEVAGPVVGTTANENNEIGVPLTLLKVSDDTATVVVEMGMRGRGQIRLLTLTAEPDVAVVTAIAPVHLEAVGTLAGIVAAKAEIFEGLRPGGVAVVPADEAAIIDAARRLGVRVLRFAFADARGGALRLPDAEVRGVARRTGEGRMVLEVEWPGGSGVVPVPFTGAHRIRNAVTAAAACYAAGLPVEDCLSRLPDVAFTPLRGEEVRVGGVVVRDDTYNANPAAVRLALDDLVIAAADTGRRAVAVLGDMLELGSEAHAYHREVGAHAAAVGVELLWGIGPFSRAMLEGYDSHASVEVESDAAASQPGREGQTGVGWASRWEDALEELVASLEPDDMILVKGSRGIKLDGLVRALIERLREGAPSPESGEKREGGTLA